MMQQVAKDQTEALALGEMRPDDQAAVGCGALIREADPDGRRTT
jgi:hypothetical protein